MASENIDVGDKGKFNIRKTSKRHRSSNESFFFFLLSYTVQWNYGGGHPQGTAAEIKDQPGEKVQIVSQKGNTVTRNADEENPAVRVERRGEGNNNDVVKRMSELTKVGGGEGLEGEGEKTREPAVGEKRGPSGETQGETTTAQEKTKKPRPKKAKTGPEVVKKGAEGAEPSQTSKRGRGRGRGKAAASTGGRKPSTRSKKGPTDEAQETATETTAGESTTVDVTTEADAPGEPEHPADTPAAHTRSQTL